MLSEEALILVAAFAGLALLVLGVMEEVWPSRPRHPRRPSPARDPWRRRTRPAATNATEPPAVTPLRVDERPASAPPPPPPAPAPTVADVPTTELGEVEPPIERLLMSQAETIDEPPPPPAPPREASSPPASVTPLEPPAEVEGGEERVVVEPPAAADVEIFEPARVEPASAPAAESAIEQLSALWEDKRFTELAREGMAVLASGGLNAEASAKVWGLVAFAKQALGDADGARAAFEEAIIAAPPSEAPTWTRHLAALSLSMAQSLLARGQSGGALDAEERVTTIRSAMNWLEGGLAAMPADVEVRQTLATARQVLWPTYEEVINALIQRQEFHGARRLLREALADEECPPGLHTGFRELLSTTFGGEVGQLTAEAIRRMQEGKEEEALGTLERAESVLATIPADAIPAKRRQELERRLWWSYTKLGLRRVEGGMWEEALPPLMHALSFEGVGPERHEETLGPLVRALEGMVEARAPLIRRLTEEGDRDGALAICEKLWSFLKTAMERGVSQDALAGALGRAQQLFDKLGRKQS